MKQPFLIKIYTLLLVLLMSTFSVSNLSAQVVADSVHTSTNQLAKVFKEEFKTAKDSIKQDTILQKTSSEIPDSLSVPKDSLEDMFYYDDILPQYELADSLQAFDEDSLAAVYAQRLMEETHIDDYFSRFNPTPAKAVWMAALFPGAGQIYNRKYWKLPIVYGGFLALIYGYNFNQRYFKTYQNAYRDMVTDSPNASYLQFLPGRDIAAKKEFATRHHDYLLKTFTRKKDTYRNWRDYCIVGMLGVYLVSIVDAYVDAALYHFDISPELDAYNSPSMMVSYKIDF